MSSWDELARKLILAWVAILASWSALGALTVLGVVWLDNHVAQILLAVWLLAVLACGPIWKRKYRSWLWLPLAPVIQLFHVVRSLSVRRE